jgi:hypothetical protein
MRLEAKDSSAAAMLGPGGFAVLVTRRSDHRGVDKSSGLDRDRLRSELSRHRVEQGLVQVPGDQVSPKAYEGGSLWRYLVSREAAEPPKRRPVIQGFGKLDVGQTKPSIAAFAIAWISTSAKQDDKQKGLSRNSEDCNKD